MNDRARGDLAHRARDRGARAPQRHDHGGRGCARLLADRRHEGGDGRVLRCVVCVRCEGGHVGGHDRDCLHYFLAGLSSKIASGRALLGIVAGISPDSVLGRKFIGMVW